MGAPPKLFPKGELRWIQVKVVDENKAETFIRDTQLKNELLNKHGLEIQCITTSSELNQFGEIRSILEKFMFDLKEKEQFLESWGN